MISLKTGGLAAVCLGAAMLIAAPMAHAANAAGVNIIYPPKRVADFDKPDETKANKTEVKVKVYVRPNYRRYFRERHRFYVDRALFQNYLGFRKVYGGRDYPF